MISIRSPLSSLIANVLQDYFYTATYLEQIILFYGNNPVDQILIIVNLLTTNAPIMITSHVPHATAQLGLSF